MALLFDLPSRKDVGNWKKIKVLVAPPGAKNISLNEERLKQFYLDNGFVETLIGTAPQCIKMVGNNIQAQQKQYGLMHCVSSMIHAAMGDTPMNMATEVSKSDLIYRLWDKSMD
eukprot:13249493-Ditylum_brightwellii.AAC.1